MAHVWTRKEAITNLIILQSNCWKRVTTESATFRPAAVAVVAAAAISEQHLSGAIVCTSWTLAWHHQPTESDRTVLQVESLNSGVPDTVDAARCNTGFIVTAVDHVVIIISYHLWLLSLQTSHTFTYYGAKLQCSDSCLHQWSQIE